MMKRFFIFFCSMMVTLLLISCDLTTVPVSSLSEDYCLLHPTDSLCLTTTSSDSLDVTEALVRQLFLAAIADYTDQSDGFACEIHFSPNEEGLIEDCEENPSMFSPVGYVISEVVSVTEGSDQLSYTITVETSDNTIDIVYSIEVEVVGQSAFFSDWSYELIDNPDLNAELIFIYRFLNDFNNASMADSSFASKYYPTLLEQSNAATVRSTYLENGWYLTYHASYPGRYYLFDTNRTGSSTEGGGMKYILVPSNGSFYVQDEDYALQPTQEYSTAAFAFANQYINDSLTSTEVCGFLDDGYSSCKFDRDDALEIGFFQITNANTYYRYDGTNLYWVTSCMIQLDDESYISLSVRATVGTDGSLYWDLGN
ncbi:MAG: hypothetical protein PHP32_04195 [Candidatus Izemoplasmatales bacterium]|nr:hypothetical protein [Candidatus Izemoplasmatales bacterium]